MAPTFGAGDVVLWLEVDNKAEFKVGDIIIYDHPTKHGEGPIAHRIIDIMKNGEYRFETKGNNRLESDAETAISAYLVSVDDLKGLVIGVIYRAASG
jgi:signal peptidase I